MELINLAVRVNQTARSVCLLYTASSECDVCKVSSLYSLICRKFVCIPTFFQEAQTGRCSTTGSHWGQC